MLELESTISRNIRNFFRGNFFLLFGTGGEVLGLEVAQVALKYTTHSFSKNFIIYQLKNNLFENYFLLFFLDLCSYQYMALAKHFEPLSKLIHDSMLVVNFSCLKQSVLSCKSATSFSAFSLFSIFIFCSKNGK